MHSFACLTVKKDKEVCPLIRRNEKNIQYMFKSEDIREYNSGVIMLH